MKEGRDLQDNSGGSSAGPGQLAHPKTMLALMRLVDKHALTTFGDRSDEMTAFRLALESRLTNSKMPPDIRMCAAEIYERRFSSILSLYARQPYGDLSDRMHLLPNDTSVLEKGFQPKNGRDDYVFDAVDRILLASRGPAIDDSNWCQVLTNLLDKKYDDRVRLAALIALINSKCGDPEQIRATLYDLALNATIPGAPELSQSLRSDARRLLVGRYPSENDADVASLCEKPRQALIELLVAKNPGIDRKKLDNDWELIDQVNEALAKDPNNAQLREALSSYADALLLRAELSKNIESKLKYATLALAAYGLDEQTLVGCSIGMYEWSGPERPIPKEAVVQKLIAINGSNGRLPAVLEALNVYQYAKIESLRNSLRANEKGVDNSNYYMPLTANKLYVLLAESYYPAGTIGRARSYRTAAERLVQISQLHISHEKFAHWAEVSDRALDLFDKAIIDAKVIQAREPDNYVTRGFVQSVADQRCFALLAQYKALLDRHDTASIQQLEARLDKYLTEYPDKDSCTFYYIRAFYKSYRAACLSEQMKKTKDPTKLPELQAQRDKLIVESESDGVQALERAIRQKGLKSEATQNTVRALAALSKSGSHKLTDDFFNRAISNARNSGNNEETLLYLKHYRDYLIMSGRQAEAKTVEGDIDKLESPVPR